MKRRGAICALSSSISWAPPTEAALRLKGKRYDDVPVVRPFWRVAKQPGSAGDA